MRGSRGRSIALRAAQVACGLVVTGCSSPPSTDGDAGTSAPDATMDAPLVFYDDDAFVDAHFPGDADCRLLIPRDRICCVLGGGEWYVYDGGFAECFVGVPGPFVPPIEESS
ncbi:MAG: hypothetical protein J0L92_00400 [Deltaproteobacteria bacterium]|nr:hypothetical protein [Deltaproteobacteria bacterium]